MAGSRPSKGGGMAGVNVKKGRVSLGGGVREVPVSVKMDGDNGK